MLIVAAGLVLFLTVVGWLVDTWTDWLWFSEVHYTAVFSRTLWTRLGLFLVFGLAVGLTLAVNLYLAYRLRPASRPVPDQSPLHRYRVVLAPRMGTWIGLLSAFVGFFAGVAAQGHWQSWMLFANAQKFGVKDPQFHLDIGYYVFRYPFWRYLVGVGFTTVVLCLLGALAIHYLFGGVRLQGEGDRITTAARAHLTTLVAAFVLLKGAAYFLDRRGLLLAHNNATGLDGAGYTDINALLTAKETLAWISVVVAVAILLFSNVFIRKLIAPGAALALLVVMAVAIGGIVPWAMQTFTVRPNVRDKEAPYIQRSIQATRDAYGLSDVQTIPYEGTGLVPPAALAADKEIVPNTRMLDPAVVSQAFTQFNQVRQFYSFGEKLDVDRYTVNGKLQDYVVGARELDYSKLTGTQANWQNLHTVFTHGYGLVAAPANRTVCGGQPYFVSGSLGEVKKGGGATAAAGECSSATDLIPVAEPRLYYGEGMGEYAIVGKPAGTNDTEYDRPTGSVDQYYTYSGTGGVPIGSYWRRMLYAAKFQEPNFLISSVFNDKSRLMYVRDPRERVEKVAPFLTMDGDPYPAVIDGRILWILDGYTTASTYPYAQRVDMRSATSDALTGTGTFAQDRQEVNYLRNSVKATVDAYTGKVTLYAFDDNEPVLKAWNKAYGGDLIQPSSAIPPELAAHFRYPEDQFKVQRDLLLRFHVTRANDFFGGQDFWEVPKDPAGDTLDKQPPYYLLTRIGDQSSAQFQLVAALTPSGRQNLAALVSGAYSDGRPRIQVLELPSDTRIPGPKQAYQNMQNDTSAKTQLTLLEGGTTKLKYGNLLSLPFDKGMLYVQPVYLETGVDNQYPLMKKVLLNYGDQVAMADNLNDAVSQLVKNASAGQQPGTSTNPPQTGTPQGSPELAAAAARINKAIEDLRAAQKSGDFTAYGKALDELNAAVQDYQTAQGQTGASPSPSANAGG
jgi:uncharacterized membrane protein (UPF0182 family)